MSLSQRERRLVAAMVACVVLLIVLVALTGCVHGGKPGLYEWVTVCTPQPNGEQVCKRDYRWQAFREHPAEPAR